MKWVLLCIVLTPVLGGFPFDPPEIKFENMRQGFTSRDIQESSNQMVGALEDLAIGVAETVFTIPPIVSTAIGLLLHFLSNQSSKDIEGIMASAIKQEVAHQEAIQFEAEMVGINRSLNQMMDMTITPEKRAQEIPVVTNRCSYLLSLFQAPDYGFQGSALGSTPYLVSFSTVYLTVAHLTVALDPSYLNSTSGQTMQQDMLDMVKLLDTYKGLTLMKRKFKVSNNCGPCVGKGMFNIICRFQYCQTFCTISDSMSDGSQPYIYIKQNTNNDLYRGCMNGPIFDPRSEIDKIYSQSLDTSYSAYFDGIKAQIQAKSIL